jgi:hypothetical protein
MFQLTEMPKFLVSAVIGCMHCLFLVLDILKQKKPNKFSAFLAKEAIDIPYSVCAPVLSLQIRS